MENLNIGGKKTCSNSGQDKTPCNTPVIVIEIQEEQMQEEKGNISQQTEVGSEVNNVAEIEEAIQVEEASQEKKQEAI